MNAHAAMAARSLSGHPLEGHAPVRFIYVDEAGTAANEPVSIVVGVIVHADVHFRKAESELVKALATIPEKYRQEGLFLHAKAIWGNPKYRDGWSMEERKKLLMSVMSIPQQNGMAISIGVVRRDSGIEPPPELGTTTAQFHQCIAFNHCIGSADAYIRNYGFQNEIATVVAEDAPDLRRYLRAGLTMLRHFPHVLEQHDLRPTVKEKELGVSLQSREFKVTRIRDTVHFVDKGDAPILQIADACAFGFRRYFSGQSHGLDFLKAIVRNPFPNPDDWSGPSSWGTFYWHPKFSRWPKVEN